VTQSEINCKVFGNELARVVQIVGLLELMKVFKTLELTGEIN
jgi:hypothetical protein